MSETALLVIASIIAIGVVAIIVLLLRPRAPVADAAAEQRLTAAVQKLIRKNEAASLALVARPLSLAIARWTLEQSDESAIWIDMGPSLGIEGGRAEVSPRSLARCG